MTDVQIPSKAVSTGQDIKAPTRSLLQDLSLLGTPEQTAAAGTFAATFTGPSQSVALIEAGATAATKWWATGLGAAVVAAWGTVVAWWGDQADNIKVTALGAAGLVTAALVLAIAYLIASDVRGRAAAAVATINARASIAEAIVSAAEATYEPASAVNTTQIVPLPANLKVKNTSEPSANEDGWQAIAIQREADGTISYLVVKGSTEATIPGGKLEFM